MAGALATGYMLGRTKKMKLALMMGSWAAGQKFGSPAEILSKGTELLSKSPEFARLNDEVRVKLLDAGKAAITAAAAQRLSSLTDSVGSSAERLATGGPLREARPRPVDADGSEGEKMPSRNPLLRFRRRGDAERAKVEEDQGRKDLDDESDESDEDDRPQNEEPTAEADEADDETSSDEDQQDEEAADETPAPAPAPKRRKAPAQRTPNGREAPAERASARRRSEGKGRVANPAARVGKSAAARSGAE